MRALRAWFVRLGELFAKRSRDRELAAELDAHVQLHIEDNVRAGMPPEEARRQALLHLGGLEQTKESCRARRGIPWLETTLQDTRFGLRMLRKNPGFTAVAILTLALGIGANTAIFSLIDAVMLRSLPVENPEQLVLLKWQAHHEPNNLWYSSWGDCLPTHLQRGALNPTGCSFSQPLFRRMVQANIFSQIAAFASADRLDLSGNGPAAVIDGQLVSGSFFRTMGLKAATGRLLQESDDAASAPPVAVLNYGYWQSAFGGSADVVGRAIELNDVPFTIVGVVESRFAGITPGSDFQIWLPLSDGQRVTDPASWRNRQDDVSEWWLTIVGRLRPGTRLAQAQAAASGVFRNEMLHGAAPLFSSGERASNGLPQVAGESAPLSSAADDPEIRLERAQTGLAGARSRYADPLYVLMLSVGVILLIACANVAGLMLARGAARQREMAVRLALGAGRGRVVRQLFTESLILSLLGGVLGVLFAYGGTRAIVLFVASNEARPLGFATGVDLRILGFTAVLSLASGVVFGIAPALRSTRVDLTPTLKAGDGASRSSARVGGGWLGIGNALVVAQVALAMIVLVGAGLLVRTLANLRGVDVGFDSRNILIFQIDPTLAGYKSAQLDGFYRSLQERLEETPGVDAASYSTLPLLSNGLHVTSFPWAGASGGQEIETDTLAVGPGFFETLRIPLLGGRGFNASDFDSPVPRDRAAPPSAPIPVIVNQVFVAKYLDKGTPVSKRFGASEAGARRSANPGYEIVGVVGDAKYSDLRRDIRPTVYTPQHEGGASFELRTLANPQAILPAVRDIVAQADPNLPLFGVRTQSQQIDRLLFEERLIARLCAFFGLLALLLACIGLYGLLSYEVSRRTREIGIRVALGAASRDVLRLIVQQGLALSLAGGLLGAGGALGATRYLKSMLYGVDTNDPVTILAVGSLLALVALAACWIPARRAMRVDPMVALRHE